MKRSIYLILLCAFFLVSCGKAKETSVQNTETSQKEGIAWLSDFNQGLALAQSSNKPVMIDFMASWCSWCKKLDADVYTNADVIEASKKFVSLKIDTDKDQATAGKYQVKGLPTIIFLNKKGEVIDKITGYCEADVFLKTMLKAAGNE